MTKTKDPDFHKALTDVNQAMLKIVEPIKRCDECRWWDNWIKGDEDFFDCTNNLMRFYGSRGEYIFHPPADFYCKYWEKKEDK